MMPWRRRSHIGEWDGELSYLAVEFRRCNLWEPWEPDSTLALDVQR